MLIQKAGLKDAEKLHMENMLYGSTEPRISLTYCSCWSVACPWPQVV